jgi:hypothetical protein
MEELFAPRGQPTSSPSENRKFSIHSMYFWVFSWLCVLDLSMIPGISPKVTVVIWDGARAGCN